MKITPTMVLNAKAAQPEELPLDCLAENGRLRRYYEEQGFIYQGVSQRPGLYGCPLPKGY